MRRFRTTIALALATLLLISVSSAQQTSTTAVPNLIRYSGTLKDAQGAVPSGTPLGVTFAIYKQQDGGAAVWQETQNVTLEANGQYSVVLGSTTATGLPDDLFSQQEQRWLGVQVQGQAEQARVLLVSVPYAFKAHEAETLGGLPPSAFVKAAPADWASSTSASSLTNAAEPGSNTGAGNSTSASIVNNGPCPAVSFPRRFYIPVFTSPPFGANVICDSVIFQNGFGSLGPPTPNVGIGMIPGAARLDINGNVNTTNTVSSYMIGYAPVLQISGTSNLFVGENAGTGNTGAWNTFTGFAAGYGNTGDTNTFTGAIAGANNTGSGNTISGVQAGEANTGSENTFTGALAGGSFANGGSFNTFTGYYSGGNNLTGNSNVFLGAFAGYRMLSGSSNTFVGPSAGKNETAVSNNIEIGTLGPAPSNANNGSNTILIGTEGSHTDTYIAGIYLAPTTVNPNYIVCVDSTGKLWGGPGVCAPSSRRFKEQIHDMEDSSSQLMKLRPVTFFYKPQQDDGSHLMQYGLIAEEVAKVYPEMVVYDKDGQPYSVRYQLLAPMLLNELQKEHTVVMAQQDELQTQLQQIKAQRQEIDGLERQLQQQNASLQKRLQSLESYVATQMKIASDVQPATTASPSGDTQ
jgi:hypothetical protein